MQQVESRPGKAASRARQKWRQPSCAPGSQKLAPGAPSAPLAEAPDSPQEKHVEASPMSAHIAQPTPGQQSAGRTGRNTCHDSTRSNKESRSPKPTACPAANAPRPAPASLDSGQSSSASSTSARSPPTPTGPHRNAQRRGTAEWLPAGQGEAESQLSPTPRARPQPFPAATRDAPAAEARSPPARPGIAFGHAGRTCGGRFRPLPRPGVGSTSAAGKPVHTSPP